MKRASARIAPKRKTPTDDAGQEYMARVRRLPCCARSLGPCMGPLQAHHHTHGRGKGTKTDDRNTCCLCLRHHHDFHAATGAFKDMDQAARRAWQDAMVAQTQAMLAGAEHEALNC